MSERLSAMWNASAPTAAASISSRLAGRCVTISRRACEPSGSSVGSLIAFKVYATKVVILRVLYGGRRSRYGVWGSRRAGLNHHCQSPSLPPNLVMSDPRSRTGAVAARRGSGAHQHRQDPPGGRADAGPRLGHDRPAAEAAGARDLRPDRQGARRALGGPDHRRGEDRPAPGALFRLHRRGHAARPARWSSWRWTRSSSAPTPSAGHVFTQRLLGARGRYETMFLGAGTMAPLIRRLLPAPRSSPASGSRP